jgi:diguanylate cyclase (GGDEF)-like protein
VVGGHGAFRGDALPGPRRAKTEERAVDADEVGAAHREAERLATLQRYGIVARPLGSDFDDVVGAAAALCRTPIAAINVLDRTHQVTMSAVGAELGPSMVRAESWCARVVTSGREMHVPDIAAVPALAATSAHREAGLTFYLGVPVITSDGVSVGSLCVADSHPRSLLPDQVRGVELLGRVVGSLLEARRQLLTLARVSTEFEEAAATDPLTGLPNRRGIRPLLAAFPPGTSVAVLDLDDFKRVNDERGHPAGDELLRLFADTMRTTCRSDDHPARWGGEEFLLLLPDTDAHRAAVVLEHLRTTWARSSDVTFSAGVASIREWESVDGVLDRADTALYSAKRGGRNQVVVSVG